VCCVLALWLRFCNTSTGSCSFIIAFHLRRAMVRKWRPCGCVVFKVRSLFPYSVCCQLPFKIAFRSGAFVWCKFERSSWVLTVMFELGFHRMRYSSLSGYE
jgi:hypothetical protein